jgi:hypothetical protein
MGRLDDLIRCPGDGGDRPQKVILNRMSAVMWMFQADGSREGLYNKKTLKRTRWSPKSSLKYCPMRRQFRHSVIEQNSTLSRGIQIAAAR